MQTYVAKQNLLQFTERLQGTASIWTSLKDFRRTHQPLVIDENPWLKTLVIEIFLDNSHKGLVT